MKKIITALALMLTINSYAQLTLEHKYTLSANSNLSLTNLTTGGYKYYVTDVANNQVVLYNTNHSVYKTISSLPTPPTSYTLIGIGQLSDQLFNTDALIEFSVQFQGPSFSYQYGIYNETGSCIFNNYSSFNQGNIYNIGGSFKYVIQSGNYDTTLVYALPGTLPCDACGGLQSGIAQQTGGAEKIGLTSQPMPNPSDGNAVIKYTLPNGTNKGEIVIYNMQGTQVKAYMIDRTFDTLVLSNTDLATGTYFYQLKTNNGFSDTKKMLIIK